MSTRGVMLAGLVVGWVGTVVAGLSGLLLYASAGEPGADAPPHWPGLEPAHHGADSVFPVAVCTPSLSVHPEQRARVGLAAGSHGRASQPNCGICVSAAPPTGWERTALYRQIQQVPGLHCVADQDGQEARHFRAALVGVRRCYDPHGHLVFSGSLTSAWVTGATTLLAKQCSAHSPGCGQPAGRLRLRLSTLQYRRRFGSRSFPMQAVGCPCAAGVGDAAVR